MTPADSSAAAKDSPARAVNAEPFQVMVQSVGALRRNMALPAPRGTAIQMDEAVTPIQPNAPRLHIGRDAGDAE